MARGFIRLIKKLCSAASLMAWVLSVRVHAQLEIPVNPLTIPPDSDTQPFSAASPDSGSAGLEVSIRTDLLRPFIERETTSSDDVAMRVLDADVRGRQTTSTTIRLAPQSSTSVARLDISATGTVQSNTVGFTRQARVSTAGVHSFQIRKPVFFDGSFFRTKKAFGQLQARQYPQTVNTMATGIPIVGDIGNQIAWNEVYRRMPLTDAIVVRRVADDVMPKVNGGVDRQLAELNQKWGAVRRQLQALSTDDIQWSAASTAEACTISVRNMILGQLSDTALSSNPDPEEAVVLMLADTAVNRWLDTNIPGGLTIADTAMQDVVRAFQDAREDPAAMLAAFRKPDLLQSQPAMFSIQLADQQAVGLSFSGGELRLQLQFRVIPLSGAPGQLQRLTITLKGQSESDGAWSVALRGISIEPAELGDSPDSWTQLISDQADAIVQRVPPTRLPRTIDLQNSMPKLPAFRIHRIQTQNGWLRFALRQVSDNSRLTTHGM